MTDLRRLDAWVGLRQHTPARIALGSSGNSITTQELLHFSTAHAQARDAVHLPMDTQVLCDDLAANGLRTLTLQSAAPDRAAYIRRPDLGKKLSPQSAALLACIETLGPDLLIVVADGLSSNAAQTNAAPLLKALMPLIASAGLTVGPVVVAMQARVALGDPIGQALNARMLLMLIGERPGLSSPDSLGAYLTWRPKTGRIDSERNCVSNIRPDGLPVAEAAKTILWLVRAAYRLGATGIALKDDSLNHLAENSCGAHMLLPASKT